MHIIADDSAVVTRTWDGAFISPLHRCIESSPIGNVGMEHKEEHDALEDYESEYHGHPWGFSITMYHCSLGLVASVKIEKKCILVNVLQDKLSETEAFIAFDLFQGDLFYFYPSV